MTTNGPRFTPEKSAASVSLSALLDSPEFQRSACKENPASNLWVDDRLKVSAKDRCRPCPARTLCAAHALDHGERNDVWGGLDDDERQRIVRQRTRARSNAKKAQRTAAEQQALAALDTYTRPDLTVVRTARQLTYVKAIAGAGGDLRAAVDEVGTTYTAMCNQYIGLAARAGMPDRRKEHVPEVLLQLAVVLAKANLGQAA